jgi:FtsP/CotA-like multicopper oxidase with cupredoxin domain
VGAAAAATATAALPRGLFAAADPMALLEAQVQQVQLAPAGYPQTEIWGYGGQMPGPELRVKQGQNLRRRFKNSLPQGSSVHWHGIRSDNRMDGVSGLTQDAVPPGGEFDYDFKVPDAGTFWYHAHNQSTEQVARGLYGALIVEESEAPDVDRDEVLVLDDWLLDPKTVQIDANFTSPHDRGHAGRIGNFVATNGVFELSRPVVRNERLRLRIVNAANARIFDLSLSGLEGWVMAYDGMPLPAPEAVPEQLVLGPGQRADLIVDVVADAGESAFLLRREKDQAVAQVVFPVTGAGTRARRAAARALPANPDQEVPGVESARRVKLNMAGGAMGSLDAAILNGERRTVKQLYDANQFWAFNGTVGLTGTPLAEIDRGETLRVAINNDTAFPHAIHLHGMHFREVLPGGKLGALRDTLLTYRGETREIAFLANNPGDWLFHCHMLSHAGAGMMTWLKVTA